MSIDTMEPLRRILAAVHLIAFIYFLLFLPIFCAPFLKSCISVYSEEMC